MPSRTDTPRDLLFGLLALQTGLIDQTGLVVAFLAWTRARDRPMGEILVEQGVIDDDQRSLIDGLAAQHLKKHGGDAERSLAALGAGPSTREKLTAIADPDLDASLATVGPAAEGDDPYRTASHAAGSATSDGQRFRVLRPHARGGLGEVFVALDAELNREVALKEILEHHADDPNSRSRFLVEAEITGGLEHPGIVPVYGLGHHADGRPYYAMRFIRGDNLKEAIARYHRDDGPRSDPGARMLALRKLLQRFVDVCNAIEYAHGRGILHRDIKPGNVIVGKHGETLVVDWGLAKPIGRTESGTTTDERSLAPSSASGSSETLPGQAIGTPAYMSPEQAAGHLDRLGPRSDVYSLGATLYSLLTGKPPFESGDLGAVLRAVQEGAFPGPRSVDPTIDPALEAVCLRAMATSPDRRYPTPRALAEDIERWSADVPVTTYREPIARRARRWARRHRTAVTAASAATLAAVIGLAGILAVQSRANRDLKSKNDELTDANRRVIRANADLKAANAKVRANNALLVAANARESRANADLKAANDRVQARFDLAQESIHAFQAAVTEDQILKDERFRGLRAKLLRSAAEFSGKLGDLLEGQTDRRSLLALARAYHDLGVLTEEIGVKAQSLAIYRKELTVRRALARDRAPEDLLELAWTLLFVGKLADNTADIAAGLAAYDEARGTVEGVSWPASLTERASTILSTIDNNKAVLLARTGQTARALEAHGRALQVRRALAEARPAVAEYQDNLATTLNNIAALLVNIGEPVKAREAYGRALEIQSRLSQAHPAVTEYQADVARSHNNLGSLFNRTGELARALESHGRALEIRRRLAEANPAVTEYLADLASSYSNLGSVLGRTGELARALESHGRALEIRRRLAEANPAVTEYQAELATSHGFLGYLHFQSGDPAKALESYNRALEIRRRLAGDNPSNTAYRADLASSHNNIGVLQLQSDDPARALESFGRALEIRRALADSNLAVPDYQMALMEMLVNIGAASANLGRTAEAVASFREAVSMEGRLPRDPVTLYQLACHQAQLAGLASLPGSGLSGAEVKAEEDRAMTMLRRAVSAGSRSLGDFRTHVRFDPLRRRPDFQALLMDLAFPDDPFPPDAGNPKVGRSSR